MNGYRVLIIFPLVTAWAFASIGSSSLEGLVKKCDLIVVAKVTKITLPVPDRFAEAIVSSVWKGRADTATVLFRASPSWSCDTACAVLNEDVLLFLHQGDGNIYTIAHAGRGRMPLRMVKGEVYATLWDNIRLGPGVSSIPGPDPRYDFIRSVRLDALRRLVRGR